MIVKHSTLDICESRHIHQILGGYGLSADRMARLLLFNEQLCVVKLVLGISLSVDELVCLVGFLIEANF